MSRLSREQAITDLQDRYDTVTVTLGTKTTRNLTANGSEHMAMPLRLRITPSETSAG